MALEVSGGKNDLLISEPSDHTMLVFLEFGAILIATKSSWYFPYPYRYLRLFYFRITNKSSTQPSWKQRYKKYYPSLNMKPQGSIILTQIPLMALRFSWPGNIRNLFDKSEIGDTDDTFKFILFAFGNNMAPLHAPPPPSPSPPPSIAPDCSAH